MPRLPERFEDDDEELCGVWGAEAGEATTPFEDADEEDDMDLVAVCCDGCF